jgi:uncharacterized protein YggE
MKRFEKHAPAIVLGLAALIAAPGLRAQATTTTVTSDDGTTRTIVLRGHGAPTEPRTITVRGHGEVDVTPDIATLRFGASETGQDIKAMTGKVTTTVQRFLALTDRLGIAREAVVTTALNVQPNYRYDRESNERVLTGYTVSRQLTVQLEALEQLGGLIEGSVSAGVNEASPAVLGVRDRASVQRDALALGAEDARAQAQRLATTLGVDLAGVRRIDTVGIRGPEPRAAYTRMAAADESAGATYSPGTVTVSADVLVVFDITPKAAD